MPLGRHETRIGRTTLRRSLRSIDMNDHHEDADDGSDVNHDHDGRRMMMSTMVVMIVTHERCMDMMIDMMIVMTINMMIDMIIMVMITMTPSSLLTYSTDEDEGSEYTRDAVCVCLHWSFVHLRILYQLWIDRQTDRQQQDGHHHYHHRYQKDHHH